MTFQDSIRTCFSKYADFSGRASRSEYWWFFLFSILVSLVAGAIGYVASTIVFLGLLLPSLAAATRRLHDTGKSGWWQLVGLIPVVGFIVLVVLLAMESRQPD
ncbi:MAG: DUF805 domain-containing protein [Proteobacteria bacterium]|jgi:uncharacterized membrane protein YhaH (DUF805 family)|nr:DUF805 domain-containing protein [Methylibium sp.]MBY0368739.1 DUF805 domain-containing protein [Burkholderiaceae bacterium]MCH8854981.1 DUF805 domain-containing protein [Pseudomonadota bacterium]|mmetsp:Transcript_11807/g.27779  ORF Transcript_11807/g.27779 Transcript_11807/m.27779 type:complete len:103 (-) Transcript_11807:155-463(-)